MKDISDHVRNNCNGYWNPFDQGRYAHAYGQKRDENPWHHLPSHVNYEEWYRGWDQEEDNFQRAGATRLMAAIKGTTVQ